MVCGVFSSLRFPYAHFSTTGATGASLFLIVWEAIERLERLGFKVIALTGDGASPNRKLFSLHSVSAMDLCYKVPNPYTQENRHVYFFSFLLKKLSKEHLDLTSFSRMRVDLAAEVRNNNIIINFVVSIMIYSFLFNSLM